MGGKHMDGHNKKKMEKMWFQNEYFFGGFFLTGNILAVVLPCFL